MTPEELDAIDARTKAAIPGPWFKGNSWDDSRVFAKYKNGFERPVLQLEDDGACGDPECCGGPTYHISVREEDLDFIVAAATDVPALVAEVRRLTSLLPKVG